MESFARSPEGPERVRHLPNNIAIVSMPAGDILVNSPPETLKYLLANGLSVPGIVLLPPDIPHGQQLGSSGFVHQGVSYASVEFLIYANYFGQTSRRTRLITVTDEQARRLRILLEETAEGPRDLAAYGPYPWLKRECEAVGHFPPLGHKPRIDDMATIESLESGGGVIGSATIRLEGDTFIFSEHDLPLASVSTRVWLTPRPLTLAPPRPLLRQELTLQFIGSSDGFDPAGITTCFLAYLGGAWQNHATLFDTAAYLCIRLGYLGFSPAQISEVVLSHLHEDHLAGLPELILVGGHRVRLITSDIIYHGLLRVMGAMLAVSEAEVAELFDYYPLNPGQPLELEGRRFESSYAVHSVPTIAVRANSLCYSGDMRYDEEWFAELEARGVLSAERRAELIHFAEGADVLVQDVGGGAIHSTLTVGLLHSLAAKSQRIVLAHTSKHLLPIEQSDLASRFEFADSGYVVATGGAVANSAEVDLLATLSACPLFARLPYAERAALAEQTRLAEWDEGEVIIREGEASNGYTYVVHSGLVEISVPDRGEYVLGRGHCIGERGAIHSPTRVGTIIARGRVQLVEISPTVFLPVAERLGLPGAFARADWLWSQPLFISLPWAILLDLALEFQPREIEEHEQLFAINEPGYEGYLLISGAVAIQDAEGKQIHEFTQPYEFFGIQPALQRAVHTVAARVTASGQVWTLPSAAIQRLHMVYPHVLLHLRSSVLQFEA